MNKIKYVKIESRQNDKSYEADSLEDANKQLDNLVHQNGFEDDKFDVTIIWNDNKKIKTRINVDKSNRSTDILTQDLITMKHYWIKSGEAGDEIKAMVLSKKYEGLIIED